MFKPDKSGATGGTLHLAFNVCGQPNEGSVGTAWPWGPAPGDTGTVYSALA